MNGSEGMPVACGVPCAHCLGSHPTVGEVEVCGRKVQAVRRGWLADELAAMAGERP